MTDHDHKELRAHELADDTIAEYAAELFLNHTTNCPRCTDNELCLAGAELRLIKIEANDDTLEDGSDVTTDAMAKAWAGLREASWLCPTRHPSAPERCPGCEWSNGPLMNYGVPGAPKWLCHGCATRAIGIGDERDTIYTERTRLVVALAGLCRLLGYNAGMRDDPAAIAPWKRVLLIDVPDMPSGSFQASWHVAEKDLALVAHLPEFPLPWNGHTSGEKYKWLHRAAVLMSTSTITSDQQDELRNASGGDRIDVFARSMRIISENKARFDVELDNFRAVIQQQAAAIKEAAQNDAVPIPMRLHCPDCGELHIDEGEFATKRHHTHECQRCGLTWRPSKRDTVGVRFLFKTDDTKPWYGHASDAITKDGVSAVGMSALKETP